MKAVRERGIGFLVVMIMVCASGDTMFFGLHKGFMYGLAIISLMALVWLSLKKGRISREMLFLYVAFAGLIFISMAANLDFTGYTQWFFAAIALLTVCNIEFETFCSWFDVIMFWVCFFSLIGVGIWRLMPFLLEDAPVISTGVMDARYLLVTCVPMNFTASTFRNYGIFWEPGKFAVYIGIALFIQLYVSRRPSLVRVGIYAVTLLTTHSTTGIVAVGFMICLWLITSQKSKLKHFKLVMIIGIFAAAIYILTYRYDLIAEVIRKFDTSGPSAASVNSRFASVVVGIWIGITHLFTGAGAVGAQNLFYELGLQWYGTSCFANMIAYLFAAFGILFLGLIVWGLWGIGRTVCQNKVKAWGIVLYFVLLYSGQIMTYCAVFYVLIFYGWDYLQKKLVIRRRKCNHRICNDMYGDYKGE